MYLKDVEKIPKMSVLNLYRNSLKLVRLYPSITKDNMREAIIEDYREFSQLKDQKEIDEAIRNGQMGLRHLMSNEVQRRKFHDIPVYLDEEEERLSESDGLREQELYEEKKKQIKKSKTFENFEEI